MKNSYLVLVFAIPAMILHAQTTSNIALQENRYSYGSYWKLDKNADKSKKSYLYLQLKLDNGGFLPTSSDSTAQELVKSSYYFGIDVRLAWQRRDPDILAQLHRYPKAGIGFFCKYI